MTTVNTTTPPTFKGNTITPTDGRDPVKLHQVACDYLQLALDALRNDVTNYQLVLDRVDIARVSLKALHSMCTFTGEGA